LRKLRARENAMRAGDEWLSKWRDAKAGIQGHGQVVRWLVPHPGPICCRLQPKLSRGATVAPPPSPGQKNARVGVTHGIQELDWLTHRRVQNRPLQIMDIALILSSSA
jgi:hypothetical protein